MSLETVLKAHKIQLRPTKKQVGQLENCAGTARFTYNWGLQRCKDHYESTGKHLSGHDLCKIWTQEKPEWVNRTHDSASISQQRALQDVGAAFQRFFKKTSKFPKFKSKHMGRDSFYLANDRVVLNGKRIKLPKLGWIKLTEKPRFEGKLMSAVVSRKADRWYVSLMFETQHQPAHGQEELGIDLGLTTFATLSTGEEFLAPKPLKANLDLLRRRSIQHSRKQKGSNNRKKSAMKLAKLHARIANVRNDFLHKLTSSLVARTKLLVIEDLNVEAMKKLWGRAISDAGFYEFKRQLTYKCEWNDVQLVKADRWYPSSQLCSGCGNRQPMELSQRHYDCPSCGLSLGRDHNAALNLRTAGLAGTNACGQEGPGYKHEFVTKPSWLKQELTLRGEEK